MSKNGVAWTLYENSLPIPPGFPDPGWASLASVSFDNEIFLSGEIMTKHMEFFHLNLVLSIPFYFHIEGGHNSGSYSDSILQFQKEEKKFTIIGKMQQGRQEHSMTVRGVTDYQCN